MVEQLKEVDERLDLLAHSYGGIILKYILFKNPEFLKKTKSVTFVAVPHGGTWPALFVTILPAARDVLPISNKVRQISTVPLPPSTVNFLSQQELKVWPRRSGLLKNYINIVIPHTAHGTIIHNDNFFEKALAFIESDFGRLFISAE